MNKQLLSALSGLVLMTFAGGAFAQSGEILKRATPEQTILKKLQDARPDISFEEPRKSPFPGLYQVQVPGGPVLYVTPEGDKFILGEPYSITETGFAKLEDPEVLKARKLAVQTLDPKQSIIFKPKTKSKSVVYVFTDVDCGYCRKLHGQMHAYTEAGVQKPGYNDLGIEIRYLAFPRAGIPSPSADKLVSAWCAKDKQAALTKAKNNENIPTASCENPIAAQFELGGRLGVNATPALLFPDGSLQLGYIPPADMAKKLGI
jgi:thiol:disulfide interchange protein DsbC